MGTFVEELVKETCRKTCRRKIWLKNFDISTTCKSVFAILCRELWELVVGARLERSSGTWCGAEDGKHGGSREIPD
jgi:hypothetical protein